MPFLFLQSGVRLTLVPRRCANWGGHIARNSYVRGDVVGVLKVHNSTPERNIDDKGRSDAGQCQQANGWNSKAGQQPCNPFSKRHAHKKGNAKPGDSRYKSDEQSAERNLEENGCAAGKKKAQKGAAPRRRCHALTRPYELNN